MNITEKIAILKSMTGECDRDMLTAYLNLACSAVLLRAYPFHPEKTDVPACYEMTQIEIAAYLVGKRGAEGETSHSENGISRSYESAGIPESMLSGIVPFAGVIS